MCDGVAEVTKAARDELRKGAHCIKIMASGGVASPTDRCEDVWKVCCEGTAGLCACRRL